MPEPTEPGWVISQRRIIRRLKESIVDAGVDATEIRLSEGLVQFTLASLELCLKRDGY